MNKLGKPFRTNKKESEQKVIIDVKMPHANKKILIETANFCSTPFCLTSELKQKRSHRKTTFFFAPLTVSA